MLEKVLLVLYPCAPILWDYCEYFDRVTDIVYSLLCSVNLKLN